MHSHATIHEYWTRLRINPEQCDTISVDIRVVLEPCGLNHDPPASFIREDKGLVEMISMYVFYVPINWTGNIYYVKSL